MSGSGPEKAPRARATQTPGAWDVKRFKTAFDTGSTSRTLVLLVFTLIGDLLFSHLSSFLKGTVKATGLGLA